MTNRSSCSECKTFKFIGFGVCPACKELLPSRLWFSINQIPSTRQLVLIRGRSGNMVHPTFVITGYCDPEWRPRDPWRTIDGSSFRDFSWLPEEWSPLTADILPPDLITATDN